jgi:non-ribosomal peptide synthetase component F
MWTPVAMLRVMKAGGASVALDTTQPKERLLSIVEQTGAQFILCSPLTYDLASKLTNTMPLVVDGESVSSYGTLLAAEDEDFKSPAKPSDLLYVVFTSGSTGTPKGVLITHSNFTSAGRSQQDILHFKALPGVRL